MIEPFEDLSYVYDSNVFYLYDNTEYVENLNVDKEGRDLKLNFFFFLN